MSWQRGNLTNPFTSTRTVTVQMLVTWRAGEMPDIATLRATRSIEVEGTVYDTFWHTRGRPHEEFDAAGNVLSSSLWRTYATWRMTVKAGVATPADPTYSGTVEVIANANTTPTFSVPTWTDELDVTFAYTDVNAELGNTAVSRNVTAAARAAEARTRHVVATEGGKRTTYHTAWLGPGRHHAGPMDANGDTPSGISTPTEVSGLVQAHVWIEARHDDAHATVRWKLGNEAAFPYPAAPCDNGERTPGSPQRPNLLDHRETDNPYQAASWAGPTVSPVGSEQLERPKNRSITGLTVTISHATTTVHARPWWIDSYPAGAGDATGPVGTVALSGTNNNTAGFDITGLADAQAFGWYHTVSATSGADAEEKANNPSYMNATPTYATWLASTRSREFSGENVDGDVITVNALSTPLNARITTGKLRTWFQRGNTHAALGWLTSAGTDPWAHPPGSRVQSGGQGKHNRIGFLQHGEAVLAGSPAHQLRLLWACKQEWTVRPGAHIDQPEVERTDTLLEPGRGGRDRHAMFVGGGSDLQKEGYVVFGRYGLGATSSNAPKARYNNAAADFDNPDSRGSLSAWTSLKGTHSDLQDIRWANALYDDPMFRHLMRVHANFSMRSFPHRTYNYNTNPRSRLTRAEFRQMSTVFDYWATTDDDTWADRAREVIRQRVISWRDVNRRPFWQALGGSNTDREPGCGRCGLRNANGGWDERTEERPWLAWQIAQGCAQMVSWALVIPDMASAADLLESLRRMVLNVVDHVTMIDPDELSEDARRPIDQCFDARAAQILERLGAGNPGIPTEGLLIPKFQKTGPLERTAAGSAPTWTGIFHDTARTNGGQNIQQHGAYYLAEAFAANRAIAGFLERSRFARDKLEEIFPSAANGEDYADVETERVGLTTGTFWDGQANPGPRAAFTVAARTGAAPFTAACNAANSIFFGGEAGVTLEWFAHVPDPTSFPAEATLTQAWSAGTEFAPIYADAGTYNVGLRITQADGQTDEFVDLAGIVVGGVTEPPTPKLEVSPLTGTVPFDVLLDASGSVAATGETITQVEYWEDVADPASPGTADQTIAWGTARQATVSYTTAGTKQPMIRVTQSDAQTATVWFSSGVVASDPVVENPVMLVEFDSVIVGPVPLAVVMDGGASQVYGDLSLATVEWWEDVTDPSNPGTPDVSGAWLSNLSFSPTYNSVGNYRPMGRITQSNGATSTWLPSDGVVIQAQGIPLADPPSGITVTISNENPDPGETLYFTEADTGVPSTSWTWQYRLAGDPWETFSTARDAELEAPEAQGETYEVRCRVGNVYGTTDSATLTFTTTVQSNAPTVDVVLSRYLFEITAENWPTPFFTITENNSTDAVAYAIELNGSVLFAGETIPTGTALALPGKGTHTLVVRAINAQGVIAEQSIPVTVRTGEELEGLYESAYELVARYDPDLPNDPEATT